MILTCPRDRLPLTDLKCPNGHQYPSFEGIPVLLRDDVPETITSYTHSLQQARGEKPIYDDEDYVSRLVASAAGYLYKPLVGNLKEYPIPDIPVEGSGSLLDVGCNWGRWTISAAQKGFKVVGVDSALDALRAAQKVCKKLEIEAEFICADARYLPFPDNSFDQAFSFSVLQHFSKEDARRAFAEMKRTAKHLMVEIPGKYGVRALQNQARRRFKEGKDFDVRYWTPKELKKIGRVEVHAYFGTGVLYCDRKYIPLRYHPILYCSEGLRYLSRIITPLRYVADSFYVIR
jgi:SAM-dependent methyltransferase